MLKQVRFQNLGLFNGSHCYKIGNPEKSNHGLFAIFVGENGSRKSSIFEFIRRCLSSEITKTESNKCDPEQAAFAKCDFDFEENPWDEMQSLIPLSEKIMIKKASDHPEEKLSISFEPIVKEAKKKEVVVCIVYKKGNTPVKYKLLKLIFQDQDQTQSSILLLERTLDTEVKDFMITGEVREVNELLKLVDGEENTLETVEKLIKKLEELLNAHLKIVTSSQERYMKGFVEAVYGKLFGKEGRTSFLFAHRGLAPLDSSLSDKMSRGKQNYEDTVSKADLIAVKLRKIEEQKKKSMEGENIETKYKILAYEILGNESYEFKVVGRNNVCMIDKDNRYDNVEVELLKAPEGVYEAHILALLLTEVYKDKYFTLCLDEPNKCMHPAQVERLRDILLEKVRKRKCSIIASTHCKDMIGFDTWKHIHYFRRYDGGNLTLTKVPSEQTNVDMFTRGTKPFRDIFFARRCLFVEGINDYRFFTVLLREWCADEVNRETDNDTKENKKKQCLQNITLLELDGCGNSDEVRKFCVKIGISFLVWLDADQKSKVKTGSHIFTWEHGTDLDLVVNHYLGEGHVNKKSDSVNKNISKMSTEDLTKLVRVVIEKDKDSPGEISKCKEIISDENNFVHGLEHG